METVIMAVRVALLILVTGLFAALWSGDHPDHIARSERLYTAPRPQSPTQRVHESAAKSRASADLPAPLPADIVPGTYLVADQFGRTTIRIIPSVQVGKPQTAALICPSHYLVESGSARWHYIRIEGNEPHSLGSGNLFAKLPRVAGKPESIEE